jgi:quercetin dioxygenase-like cupin family protein
MQRLLAVVIALLVTGTLLERAAAQQDPSVGSQQKLDASGLRQPFDRFDGTITLRIKDGQLKTIHVVIRNWIIERGQTIARFPEEGFLIVQLRGGQVATVIDGQRQERHEDEFWTVPAGSSMSIETGNDSAALQIMVVKND